MEMDHADQIVRIGFRSCLLDRAHCLRNTSRKKNPESHHSEVKQLKRMSGNGKSASTKNLPCTRNDIVDVLNPINLSMFFTNFHRGLVQKLYFCAVSWISKHAAWTSSSKIKFIRNDVSRQIQLSKDK